MPSSMTSIRIPGSKSITNRVLLLAAIGKTPVLLKNLLESDDTVFMRRVLSSFGTVFTETDNGLLVTPPLKLKGDGEIHHIGNAGTVARFVSAVSLIIEGDYGLSGVDRMHERPQSDLFKALETLGVSFSNLQNEGFLPAKYQGKEGLVDVSTIELSGNVSSQFVSALLLVSPFIEGGLTVKMSTLPPSQPYVDMTLEILRQWGCSIDVSHDLLTMKVSEGSTAPESYEIPADMSGASYPTAWSTLQNKALTIEGFGRKTLQGDEQFLDICSHFGASISRSDQTLTIQGTGTPSAPTCLDFSPMPDVAMTGMVLACFYEGTHEFIGLESLRVKECDRIQAMVEGFEQLGIQCSVTNDDVTITGGDYWKSPENIAKIQAKSIETNSFDDHRIAMCFGVLRSALSSETGIEEEALFTIGEPECVAKTWPTFWQDLASWG